jgi:methyl-accepting chemotaxis protein
MNIKEDSIEKIKVQTENISKDMQAILNNAIDDSESISDIFVSMKKSGGTKREVVNELLKEKLNKNDNYVYTWVAWEPNVFDEKDSEYINKPGCDPKGRFVPSWRKGNGELVLELCQEIDTSKYYSIPKQTKKAYITEPTTYTTISGKQITSISFCQPIIVNGKFLGVTGLDISLEQLKKINSTIKLYDNGFGRLVNNKGIVLAHPLEERVNKIGGEFKGEEGKEHLQKINKGLSFNNISWSESMGQDVYKFYSPIDFKDSNLKWSLTTIVPARELMAKTNHLIIVMIVVSIIGLLIIAFILYCNSRYAVNSMVDISNVVEKLSNYDLKYDETLGNKYLKRKDETMIMAKSIKTMQENFSELIQKVQEVTGQVSSSSEELTATIQQVANTSQEVSKTIEDISKGAMEQADNTEIGSGKISELGNLIKENNILMSDVHNAFKNVTDLINKGLKAIQNLTEKTEESGKALSDIYQVIEQTNKSSEKISNATDVIASIAEQTNLLALNAAIEAARAGEAGRGFAVVAEEIRKLAEQAGQSTKEIDTVINELMNNSENAVTKMKEVEVIVMDQILSVNDAEDKYNEISKAMDLSHGLISRMNDSVQQMDNERSNILDIIQSLSAIAEENAASTEEATASTEEQAASIHDIAGSSENLSELAQDLQKSISKFKL